MLVGRMLLPRSDLKSAAVHGYYWAQLRTGVGELRGASSVADLIVVGNSFVVIVHECQDFGLQRSGPENRRYRLPYVISSSGLNARRPTSPIQDSMLRSGERSNGDCCHPECIQDLSL